MSSARMTMTFGGAGSAAETRIAKIAVRRMRRTGWGMLMMKSSLRCLHSLTLVATSVSEWRIRIQNSFEPEDASIRFTIARTRGKVVERDSRRLDQVAADELRSLA